MTKPTTLPEWASTAGGTDLIEPLSPKKQSGWALINGVPERPKYQYFNWWQNTVYNYIAVMDSHLFDAVSVVSGANLYTDADGSFKALTTATGYTKQILNKATAVSDVVWAIKANRTQAQTQDDALNTTGELSPISLTAQGDLTLATSVYTPVVWGSALTAGRLSLRGNSADLTTGGVDVLTTLDAGDGVGALTVAGGIYVAKSVFIGAAGYVGTHIFNAASIDLKTVTGQKNWYRSLINNVERMAWGAAGTTNDGITGSAAGNAFIRSTSSLLFSTDGGTTLHGSVVSGAWFWGPASGTNVHTARGSSLVLAQQAAGNASICADAGIGDNAAFILGQTHTANARAWAFRSRMVGADSQLRISQSSVLAYDRNADTNFNDYAVCKSDSSWTFGAAAGTIAHKINGSLIIGIATSLASNLNAQLQLAGSSAGSYASSIVFMDQPTGTNFGIVNGKKAGGTLNTNSLHFTSNPSGSQDPINGASSDTISSLSGSGAWFWGPASGTNVHTARGSSLVLAQQAAGNASICADSGIGDNAAFILGQTHTANARAWAFRSRLVGADSQLRISQSSVLAYDRNADTNFNDYAVCKSDSSWTFGAAAGTIAHKINGSLIIGIATSLASNLNAQLQLAGSSAGSYPSSIVFMDQPTGTNFGIVNGKKAGGTLNTNALHVTINPSGSQDPINGGSSDTIGIITATSWLFGSTNAQLKIAKSTTSNGGVGKLGNPSGQTISTTGTNGTATFTISAANNGSALIVIQQASTGQSAIYLCSYSNQSLIVAQTGTAFVAGVPSGGNDVRLQYSNTNSTVTITSFAASDYSVTVISTAA